MTTISPCPIDSRLPESIFVTDLMSEIDSLPKKIRKLVRVNSGDIIFTDESVFKSIMTSLACEDISVDTDSKICKYISNNYSTTFNVVMMKTSVVMITSHFNKYSIWKEWSL